MIFKIQFFTSPIAQCASIMTETQLVLFIKIDAVYYENDMKSIMRGMHRI
jgi:hypothetical protein